MLIFALDDEKRMLAMLRQTIKETLPQAEVHAFSRAEEALQALREASQKPEIVFLDIEMPGISGLELAKCIKEESPTTNLIFVTGFVQYALEAIQLHPSGYIMKPVSIEKLRIELDNLRHPVREISPKRARAQTFGNFELFIDDEPVKFRLSRTKELLAYLVDRRGAACNTAELCAVLFEDRGSTRSGRSHFRTLLSDLSTVLREHAMEPLLLKHRNSFAVDTALLDCDIYRFLQGDIDAVNAYTGEYMLQYSWAEMRIGLPTDRRN